MPCEKHVNRCYIERGTVTHSRPQHVLDVRQGLSGRVIEVKSKHSKVAETAFNGIEAAARFTRHKRDGSILDLVSRDRLQVGRPSLDVHRHGGIDDVRSERLHASVAIQVQEARQRLPQQLVLDSLQLPLHRRLHHVQISMFAADGMSIAREQIQHHETHTPDVDLGSNIANDTRWMIERVDDLGCMESRATGAGR